MLSFIKKQQSFVHVNIPHSKPSHMHTNEVNRCIHGFADEATATVETAVMENGALL